MVTVKWSLLFFVTGSVFLFAALHNVQADSEGKKKSKTNKKLSDERGDSYCIFLVQCINIVKKMKKKVKIQDLFSHFSKYVSCFISELFF